MGVSTNAILAFGFNLDEKLPDAWIVEDADDDHDEDGHVDEIIEKDGAPIEILTHCSYESPCYFLALKGTEKTAHRGFPEPVEMPSIEPEQIEQMKQFCGRHGIEWQDPRWHIFSIWG